MSSPPVSPVTGIPPVGPSGSLLRAEILAQAEAVLGAALDGAAGTPTPAKAAAGGPVAATEPDAPPAQASPLVQVLDAARAAAAQRQGSLAPLLADLAQVVASPALPPAVRAAIAQVLALPTPLAGPLTAETVRQAVAQSGLFLEAHLAQTPPGGPAPPPDLKAALLTLQTALATVPAARAASPPPAAAPASIVPPPTASPAPAPASPPALTPTPTPAAASTPTTPPPEPAPGPAATTDPKAALLNLQSVPSGEPAAEPPATPVAGAPAPSVPTPPAQPAAPAAAPQTASTPPNLAPSAAAKPPSVADPELTPRITLLDGETEPAAAAPSRAPPPGPAAEPSANIPPPPHRAAALSAQPAAAASLPADAKTPAIVERLQTAVEQAVARQTLHQLASLPDGQTTAWMFELPLATPQGAAIAQFEIQRDGRGQAGGEDAAKGWRLRFSIDIEPLGPIHIHLGLNGDQAQVVVWAERETSLQWLRQGAADLANALPAEVVFHPGAPRRPTPAPGQFLDQAL